MAPYPLRRLLRHLLPESLALNLRARWLAWRTATGRGPQETDIHALARLIRPTDVCWDIGANIGMYCIALSPLASAVEAFEPVPHNLDVLGRVLDRMELRNVTVHALAVTDTPGTARMTVPADGFYGGYYLAAVSDEGNLPVITVTVDQMIEAGLPRPDFVKVDVEGAEMAVVRGAEGLLATAPPVWLIETFEDALLPAMRAHGYCCYSYLESGQFLEVTARDPHQRNYWFFPAGRLPLPFVP